MEYYGNNDWRDYLAHHGILGMKWGRRNGPPYPLDGADHSASEKKAGWRKSLGGGDYTTVRKKAKYVKRESKDINRRYKKDIKKLDKSAYKAEKKYSRAKEKGSSRSERYKELYKDKLVDSKAVERFKDVELERVRKMSLKDIKDEKKFSKSQKQAGLNKREIAVSRGDRRLTPGERNSLKENVRKEVDKNEFAASKRTLDGYVKDLNKVVKSTQRSVADRNKATRIQTIRNPYKESGYSTFKISNKDLDKNASSALKDWGAKYLTADVYAEANGYKLMYDKKKNKHYLEKK